MHFVSASYGEGTFGSEDYVLKISLSEVQFDAYDDLSLSKLFDDVAFEDIDNHEYLFHRAVKIKLLNKELILFKSKKPYFATIKDTES